MRLALAIASLAILIVHGIVFYNQFFHRWERYQTAYFDQARALAANDAEKAEYDARRPRIEQIIVTAAGEGHVDRCTTCHIAMDDPRFKDHALPLKTHPYTKAMGDYERDGRWERRHKFSDFGCTTCHDGQGRGLQVHYSHGEDHYWPKPLLGYVTQENWRGEFKAGLTGTEYMESACAQCHTEENFAATPHVNRGRQLFFETNCYGCHRIEGLSDGTLGPDLSDAGEKFKIDYLWESMVDPRANSAVSFMPRFNLEDEGVKALVIFLKSRQGRNLSETSLDRFRAQLNQARTQPEQDEELMLEGEELAAHGRNAITNRACTACHKLGAEDGGIAPDLSYTGLMRDEGWLLDHFRNPRQTIPDSIMPAFRFTTGEFRAMTAYLLTLKNPPQAAEPADTYALLCARCHGGKGDGTGISAPYLDPAPRDLTKAAFMRSKPRERFLVSIMAGVPGTSMPGWGRALTEDRSGSLLDHVYASFVKEPPRQLSPRKVPESNPVSYSTESAARGEQIFVKRCAGCHGRKADGKGPNSLDILPRPRNLLNTAFVARTSDRRLFESILYGVQGTAMPPWIDYGLSHSDVGDVVNFIRGINQKGQRISNAGSQAR
jgi:mono/diheme cytochrome c family protein